MNMIYLDHAATTPLRPEAWAAMAEHRENFGNPSGVHEVSRRAKNELEENRERAAMLIGADHPLEVVFTAGGTEADNLAVRGINAGAIVTTAIEHKAVLESVGRRAGPDAIVGVDEQGVVDPGEVAALVTEDTALVSVMLANNETGAVQPVAETVTAVRAVKPGVLVHTDAVQAFISEPVDVNSLGVDMLSLAAHKFGGPKGVGLLYVRRGVKLDPVIVGGSQELGMRAGTHNPMGVAGMVAAMGATVADRDGFRRRVATMRDRFEDGLMARLEGVDISSAGTARLAQHSNVSFQGANSEDLLILLDGVGVSAAAGSACQSGAVEVSHVLAAMGFDERRAAGSIRFSLGWTTEPEDMAAAEKAVCEVLAPGSGGVRV